jgi:hypothetical protein
MVQAAMEAASELVRAGRSDPTTRMAPLNVAALKGDVRALSMLVDAGAPVNKSDGTGLTPLTVSQPGLEHSQVSGNSCSISQPG